MRRNPILATLVSALVALLVLVTLSACGSDDDASSPSAEGSLTGVAEVTESLQGLPQTGRTLGEQDAAIEIVEYGDLQCPFCAQASEELIPELIDRYVRPGTAKLTFRAIAFIGEDSERGALAAEAAALQDRQWSLVEILYANQGAENSGWLDDDLIRDAAEAAGLDVAKFDADRESDAVAQSYFDIEDQAQSDGVTGTPYYIVSGPGGAESVTGAQSTDDFEDAIQKVR